ncbi:MAG: DUF5655 domain-containing protein [Pyrinomonadaceae bacterium]|nr:DUF5655 domain-containing protein [Pyrinomonadaceae bacterium]
MKKTNSGFKVKTHFEDKDQVVREIYDRLLSKVEQFGAVIEDPKKTSIHLVNRTAFAGVATRKTAINLTIKGDHKLSSSRISKTEQASANRFHHEVKLTSPKDVDAELVGWLKAAYGLSE